MKSTPPLAAPHLPPGIVRLAPAGIADPLAPRYAPGDLLVELSPTVGGPGPWPVFGSVRVLAAGRASEVDTHPAAGRAVRVDLPGLVLLPGLVNAHTHLDLTHLGPLPHDPGEGFVSWVDRIRAGRAHEPQAIAAAVAAGIGLSLQAGVVLVGDIAGAPGGRPSLTPLETLASSPLRGVSFLEFFAMGLRERESVARVEGVARQAAGMRLAPGTRAGLQPHAPNTVSPWAYRHAVELSRQLDLPLSTHLAETPEEREFVARGTGPQRAMLERFGLWTDEILQHVGQGRTPIEHLADVLRGARFLAAHANDLGAEPRQAIELLASLGVSIAYCPRASAYFNAPAHFGPHRYRELLEAGVNVCLGTDSIVNLPRGTDAPDGPGMSVLDEARLLWTRDGTDPMTLLRMLTTNGAAALGWGPEGFTLRPGARPLAIAAVEVAPETHTLSPLERVLSSSRPARLLALAAKA